MKKSAVIATLTGAGVLSLAVAVYAGATPAPAPTPPTPVAGVSPRVSAPPAPPAIAPVAPLRSHNGELDVRFMGESIVVQSDGSTWVIDDPESVARIRASVDAHVVSATRMAARVHQMQPAIEMAAAIAGSIDHEALAKAVEASIDHEAIAQAIESAHLAVAAALEGFDEGRLERITENAERSAARAVRDSERALRQAEKQIGMHEADIEKLETQMRAFEAQMERFEREMESLGESISDDIEAKVREELDRGNARRIE
jgi:predicted RNase H-like nuclease (RuvC/YqgF family)